MKLFKNIWSSCNSPTVLRSIHGWLSIFWLVASFPIMLLVRDAVWVVSLMSVYALLIGHWSSWQASRVEVIQYEDANVQDVRDDLNRKAQEIMDRLDELEKHVAESSNGRTDHSE